MQHRPPGSAEHPDLKWRAHGMLRVIEPLRVDATGSFAVRQEIQHVSVRGPLWFPIELFAIRNGYPFVRLGGPAFVKREYKDLASGLLIYIVEHYPMPVRRKL